ncbi:hypothetical protein CVT25_004429, partial [Psilocybe cyanescens]
DKRGRAANPANNTLWFETILLGTITKYSIKPINMYASDEIGFQGQGQGEREFVFGPHTKGDPYQQRAGTQENITGIVTICADGTTIPPSVIFKGNAYNVRWGDNNPLNASPGYQKKGWTDDEIGIEWIKQFDQLTRTKAKNEHRLLIVDGHNSHYTVPFLQYACENQIVVICYPAHGTHIYQGLDVERDNWFRSTGQPMDKNNFLQIFSKAYVAALTPENIKMAFKKTGIHPYDPSVITESMLAPSKDTSYEVHLPVPMKQASEPVQALAKALRDLQLVDSSSSVDTETMTSAAEIRSTEMADRAGPREVQITYSSNR